MAVSDQPRDEDELQALLSGESALSRRYRELSDEQPPGQIDAAILASSRWAVGADSPDAGSRRTGSRHTGSHGTDLHGRGAHGSGTTWRRSSFMRWSVPLATAAVVVVAVALTITIERDPEIDRLYDKYDNATADTRTNRSKITVGKTEVAPSEMQAQPSAPAKSSATEPPATPAPLRAPASAPVVAAPQRVQPQVQSNATPKRSEQLQQQLAAKQSEERDRSGRVAADIDANTLAEQKVIGDEQAIVKEKVPGEEKRAEAFPGSDDALAANKPADVANVAEASADSSLNERAITGASSSADSLSKAEPEELRKAGADISPGRQQPSTQPADDKSVVAQERADQDSPNSFAETEAIRNPADWIEDIEKLLADGRRDEAIASLKKFRLDFPDYPLPEDLQSLVPARSE